MAQNLQVIRETTFSRGYSDKYKPELLPKDYCAKAQNCWVDNQAVTKRTGYTEKGTDVDISKPIIDIDTAKFSDETNFLIRARNNTAGTNCVVETWNGTGVWTSLAASQTASKPHVFVVAKDACYVINDTDTVLKTTNGTTTSTVATFPKGIDAKWFHNYMFVLTGAGRLYWSTLNDPDTWDTVNDFIDINPNDGDTPVGLGILKDELFIFKQNRIWSLTGFGTADFTVDDMGEKLSGLGAVSRKSIVEAPNDIYFVSSPGGIPQISSVMRTAEGFIIGGSVISDNIEGTMDDLVNAKLSNAAGMFDGRKIWYALTKTGSYNNLCVVYDIPTKGWTSHVGINASCWTRSDVGGQYENYFGEASNTAKSYLFDSSTSDNGETINMVFESRMYNPIPEKKCKWKYLHLACDVDSDATLDIDFAKDGFDFNDLATLTLAGSSGVLPFTLDSDKLGTAAIVRERLDWAGGTAYKMQYRFANDTDSDSIAIREYQVMFKPKGLRSISEAS